MTRLIDADLYKEDMTNEFPEYYEEVLDAQPTIDAVPVIRCKDCKNNPSTLIGWIECPMTGAGTRQPNDFCSYAKPKETE